MKITTNLGYAGGFKRAVAEIAEMEKAGLDLVWVAEAYGFDSPSLMGYLAAKTETVEIGAAILPLYTRTPTLIAMTAAGHRHPLRRSVFPGSGASGPQVIEGFHGVPYTNPLGRTREIIEICRNVWRREAPLVHEGKNYTLPLPPERGTGLGKPLKIIAHPCARRFPSGWPRSARRTSPSRPRSPTAGCPSSSFPSAPPTSGVSALAEGASKRQGSANS
jgi:F420-dependent oxidoreductase-like protein